MDLVFKFIIGIKQENGEECSVASPLHPSPSGEGPGVRQLQEMVRG